MIVSDREVDTTLVFMHINNRPQEEIDLYLKDQKDIAELLIKNGASTYNQISEHFDHDITAALSYLVKSGKISFTIESGGEVKYWDWGDY